MNEQTMHGIIEFPIERVQEAVGFYTGLMDKSRFAPQNALLGEIADMERGHTIVLQNLEKKGIPEGPAKKVADLAISDYLVKPDKPADQLEYQDILILAMKREEASLRLYTDLSERTAGTPAAGVFLRLAGEEAGHKLKFETLYDQDILKEN